VYEKGYTVYFYRWFLRLEHVSSYPRSILQVLLSESESEFLYSVDRAGVQPIGCRLGPRPRAQACG